jgi:hypothetical protein
MKTLQGKNIMSTAINELETPQFVPLDLNPLPLEQDAAKRKSMYSLVQLWRRAFESWHGPLRLPSREEFLVASTEDFVLTSNGSTLICGVDAYLKTASDVLEAQVKVTMSMVILEVAEDTAWMHDVHTWTLPDGYRFESGRYGRLYRRKGEDKICRWEILQTNPIAAQEFFDTRYRFARR